MRAFIGLVILLTLASCALTVEYDRYAVVYGISEYGPLTGDAVSSLEYCDEDAVEMSTLLENQGYFVTRRIDDEATWSQLKADLKYVRETATANDLFIFYFSGHGGQNTDLPGKGGEPSEGDNRTEAIYLTQDGELRMVDDDKLGDLISEIPSRMRIVLLDACNSGGFIGNTEEIDRIPSDYEGEEKDLVETYKKSLILFNNTDGKLADIPPETALVIGASGERELAYETSDLEHGLFTYFLLESAVQGDANEDGVVTPVEAYAHIREGIEQSLQVYARDKFEPRISGGPTDYILFSTQ